MDNVVMRREPSIPAWAWASAVLALLLLMIVVWWASAQPMAPGPVDDRLEVLARNPQPVTATQRETPVYGVAGEPRPSVDWSQPTKDFQPPKSESVSSDKIKRIKIEVGKPAVKQQVSTKTETADTEKVIPPVRIRPEVDTPGRFIYNGVLWVLSRGDGIDTNEVELTELGSVDGHTLYSLGGGATEPSALFVETSPGSGQYNVYRPLG